MRTLWIFLMILLIVMIVILSYNLIQENSSQGYSQEQCDQLIKIDDTAWGMSKASNSYSLRVLYIVRKEDLL